MKILAGHFNQLLSEVKSNPRLRAGISMAALLLLGWLWLIIGDWRDQSLLEHARTEARIERMREMSNEDFWIERAAQTAELRAALASEIPSTTSPGLAQASFQTWMTRIFEGLEIRPQINMEAPLTMEEPAGLIRVSATLSGSLEPRQVTELVRRIESDRQLIVVPLLQIRSESNETFQMTVHAYFQLDAGQAP